MNYQHPDLNVHIPVYILIYANTFLKIHFTQMSLSLTYCPLFGSRFIKYDSDWIIVYLWVLLAIRVSRVLHHLMDDLHSFKVYCLSICTHAKFSLVSYMTSVLLICQPMDHSSFLLLLPYKALLQQASKNLASLPLPVTIHLHNCSILVHEDSSFKCNRKLMYCSVCI